MHPVCLWDQQGTSLTKLNAYDLWTVHIGHPNEKQNSNKRSHGYMWTREILLTKTKEQYIKPKLDRKFISAHMETFETRSKKKWQSNTLASGKNKKLKQILSSPVSKNEFKRIDEKLKRTGRKD